METPPILRPAIEIAGLTKWFNTTLALENLTMNVMPGDLFGFIGSNGAGKTTTLRILATFLQPNSGTAKIGGFDVVREAHSVRTSIGYLPDFFGVYKDMEVGEYLDFFAAAYSIPAVRRDKIVDDVLDIVGLKHKKADLVGTLSRGMQQRIGLARVLVHDPKVLLLDEPASGLDPRARIEIMAILQELQRLGKTILISSHILSELEDLCNKVAIIEKGKLLYSGPMIDIQRRLQAAKTIVIELGDNTEEAAKLLQGQPNVANAAVENGKVTVHLRPDHHDHSFIADVLVKNGHRILSLTERKMELNEVFMRLTAGETA
jgi:ABC-2 type transport system ATP-binding protein